MVAFGLGWFGVPVTGETISKVNYGVIFEEVGPMCAIYDYWAHTFEVPFPGLKLNKFIKSRGNRSMSCESLARNSVVSCYAMQEALNRVNEVRRRYMYNLNLSLRLAKEVMPVEKWNDTSSRSRSKRSLLPFIGDISHALFGTATEKEVKQMARHIDLLEKKNTRLTETFAQYSDDLSSFMTLANRRHNTLRDTIQDNHQAISALAEDMSEVSTNIHHNLQFSVLLNREIYLAMSLQEGLQEFLHGIHGLLHHQLSPYILPYKDIQATIARINNRLRRSSSQLAVKDLSPKDVYSWTNFIWTFKNESLFITVKFPLVSPISHVQVYQIYSLPVPFNQSSNHATSLLNLPDYLALTKDRHYYSFPPNRIWEQGILNAQQHNLPMHPISEPSCATALFFDNKQQIMSYCNFRVQINVMKPTITHINEGKYLLSNISHVFLRCPSGMRQELGCQFCVFTVPCLCDISTNSVYFPPRLNHCQDDQTRATTVHPVNLAVLSYFYEEEQLFHITGDTLFEDVPAVSTPKMDIFKHDFTKLIAADNEDDLSLRKIAESIKNDKRIFQTLADPILDSLDLTSEPELLSWTSIVTISDTVIIVVLCLAVSFLGVKVYTMAKVIATLQMAQPVKSKSILYIIPTSSTTTTQVPVVVIKEPDNTVLYLILALAVVTLALVMYRRLTRLTRQATLALEITDGSHCTIVQLSKLPSCPKFHHIMTNNNFHDFKVQGWLSPTFSWNKGSFVVVNLLDQSRLPVPERVTISPLQGLKLRKILRSQLFTYVVGTHGKHAFHLRVCPLDCAECGVNVDLAERPATVDVTDEQPETLE